MCDLIVHLDVKLKVVEYVIHLDITNEVKITRARNVIKCCIENKIEKFFESSSAVLENLNYNK